MIEQIPFLTRNPITGALRPVTEDLLAEAYLLPEYVAPDIDAAIADEAHPWAESLRYAAAETSAAVAHALEQLVRSVPSLRPEDVDLSPLDSASRLYRHASALLALWKDLGGDLPAPLAIWRGVLEFGESKAIEALPLMDAHAPDTASAALRALHRKLVADHGLAPEDDRKAWTARQPGLAAAAPANTSLGHAQRYLMAPEVTPRPLDETLSFLRVANLVQEAEVAAALVQGMLDCNPEAEQSSFGLLVPDDPVFCHHLAEAFHMRGLTLSGLPATDVPVDVAGETLLNFLLALGRPAPAMALASLYISPLMPWGGETGRKMAREVMRGRYNFTATGHWTDDQRGFYRMLREGDVSDAQSLHRALDALLRVVPQKGDTAEAVGQLKQRIALVRASLGGAGQGPLDWDRLTSLAAPRSIRPASPGRHVEGVTVFVNDGVPWRAVNHLVVTGFVAGDYPKAAPGNPLFRDSELLELRQKTGLNLPDRGETISHRLDLFNRQLNAAGESVTFLCRAQDGAGKPLAAPAAQALIARTIADVAKYEDLPRPLEEIRAERQLFPVREVEPLPNGGRPQLPLGGIVKLDRDLLSLRKDADGRMRPQSPSRLETLLVSPLVWTLGELGAETVTWAPEGLDVLLKGSLAHDVMERLFPAGEPLIERQKIPDRVGELTDQAIRRLAPFLQSSAWRLERRRFLQEMTQTARHWHEMLGNLKADVIANEETLRGEAQGIQLLGRCDCILRLADGTLLVVDHKRSGSRTRRERMQAGWDLQLALYREVLRRPHDISDELRKMLGSKPTAVAYHTMNDGALLGHGLDMPSPPPLGVEVLENDISEHAMEHLRTSLTDVGAGWIRLNHESHMDFFTKTAKLTPYAFDKTILARIFMLSGEEGGS